MLSPDVKTFCPDGDKTNVPNIRLAFRHQTLLEELRMISSGEKTDLDNADGSRANK